MKELAVITGGTKGIGRALVHVFVEQGFDVVTCARNGNDLEDLKNTNPNHIHTKATDMSVKNEVLAFAEFVKGIEGEVKILVNNAGLFIPGQLHTEEEGSLEKMIDTNLYSAYYLTRALLPAMMEAKTGHVFNMCSTASFVPYVNGGSYCISKFAMLGMSKVLREEMKEHAIRVTTIMPGATFTASWEGADIPEDRFMPAEDVASAVWNAYQMADRTVVEEIIMRPQLGDI